MRRILLLTSLVLAGCAAAPPPHSDPGTSLASSSAPDKPVLILASCKNMQDARYPAEALARNETGTVRVHVVVNEKGDAESISLQQSSGSKVLDDAAVEKFRGCAFQPAYKGGKAVAGTVGLEYVWKIEGRRP